MRVRGVVATGRGLLSAVLLVALGCGDSEPSRASSGTSSSGAGGGGGGGVGPGGGGGVGGSGPEEHSVDVVIVGAGSGGVAAALQAARLGANVALLEETDWVGGQMTAGAVSTMDGGADPSGVHAELIEKVTAHYAAEGKSIGTCGWQTGKHCFEPHVGQKVLLEMLAAEPAIDLELRAHVDEVLSSGTTVTGVRVTQKSRGSAHEVVFHASIVIDATERGDTIAQSPARYRVANATSDAPDGDACVQDNTYVAVVRRFPDGVPAELTQATAPPGYVPEIVTAFAGVVTKDGNHGWTGEYPVDWPTHNGYRGLPNSEDPTPYTGVDIDLISKTGVNWANDYPFVASSLLDPAARIAADCAAKLRTVQFLYYVQTELGESEWSVATDEGFGGPFNMEDNHCPDLPAELAVIERSLPVIPYVRESKRIVGAFTLTASDIARVGSPPVAAKHFETAIAVGDYPVDLHGCNQGDALETELETEADIPVPNAGGPFQVPIEVLVPEVVDGMLAAEKNLSVSRLVAGAIRLQPITQDTGQAAGALAALAISKKIAPRAVRPIEVQDALVDANCKIWLLPFSDVPRGAPHWGDAQIAATYAIMAGYGDGTFGVAYPLTRAQGAVAFAKLLGLPTDMPPATPTFPDVPPQHFAYGSVEALAKAGIVAGCSTSPPSYCPDAPLQRGAAAVILIKGLGLDPASAPSAAYYDDVPAADPRFAFVQLATQKGLVAPCDGGPTKYCPDDPELRGDAASIVRKTLLAYGP